VFTSWRRRWRVGRVEPARERARPGSVVRGRFTPDDWARQRPRKVIRDGQLRCPPRCWADPAGAVVVAAAPGHPEPDDDGGQVGAQDQGAPFGQGPEQLGGQDADVLVAAGGGGPAAVRPGGGVGAAGGGAAPT